MSGYVPKRVRNANIRLTSNQRGLKLQGLAPSIGQGRVLNRYTKSRVKSGVVVAPYPTGYRCINGVDPMTASEHALECNCEYLLDNTKATILVPPAPKNQAIAGGVGRINAPRFHCGSTCEGIDEEGNPNRHPHFHPHIKPAPPVKPISGPHANYTVSITMYGLDKDISETDFKNVCDRYINFIKSKANEVEFDRIIFSLSDNPGPGYNPAASGFDGNNMTDDMNGVFNHYMAISTFTSPGVIADKPRSDIWLYKYFVRKVILHNINQTWGGSKTKLVQVGFQFNHGDSAPTDDPNTNWTVFVANNRGDPNSDLSLPSGPITFNDLKNLDGNNINNPRNNIAQEFAYMRHFNNLLSQDPDVGPLSSSDPIKKNPLYSRVSHATWDTEEEFQFGYADMDYLWNKFLSGGESSLNPRYSNTKGFVGISNKDAFNSTQRGPDRQYAEIYDLYDYSKPKGGTATNQCDKYLKITSGLGGSYGDYGWDVAVPVDSNGDPTCGFENPDNGCNSKEACKGATPHTFNAGLTGSKYFYAKWNPERSHGLPRGFGESTDTSDGSALSFYVNKMVQTGWTAFFGPQGKLNDSAFAEKTPNLGTLAGQQGNGKVIMFSLQSRYWTYNGKTITNNPLAGGEEAFGSWSWPQFKFFLDTMAKQLRNKSPTQTFGTPNHPIRFALYEAQYLPQGWINN